MHRRRLHTAVALSLLLATVHSARADEEVPRVGVVATMAVNVDEADARELADTMGAALSEQLVVDVIAGNEAARRLPGDGLPDDCVADRACLRDVADRLDADELLMLVVVSVGAKIQIDTTWVDIDTGKTASRPAVTLALDAPAAELFAERATQLLPGATERTEAPASTTFQFNAAPDVEIVREPRHMTTAVWITGGVSAAALVGSSIFGLSAWSKNSDLEEECPRGCDPDDPRLDSLEDTALAADLLFGVAVATGATAAILYYTSDSERRIDEPAVTVQSDGQSLGIAIGGRF